MNLLKSSFGRMVAGLAGCWILAAPVLARAEIAIKIIDHGQYTAQQSQKNKTAESSVGEITESGGIHLVAANLPIPASIGSRFGMRYVVTGGLPGEPLPVTVRIFSPLYQYDKAQGPIEEWVADKVPGHETFDGFILEKESEVIPGIWTLQLLQAGKLLAEKTFTLSLYYGEPAKKSPEQKAFEQAVAANTTEACQDFLHDYPGSIYGKEISDRRLALLAERKAWEGQPLSVAAPWEKDYRLYSKADTIWAYHRFLALYPETKYTNPVKDRIEQLRYQQAMEENSDAALTAFLKEFTDSQYLPAITGKLKAIAEEREAFARCETQGSAEGFRQFLVQYPTSNFSSQAKATITKISLEELSTGVHRELRQVSSHGRGMSARVFYENTNDFPVTFLLGGPENFFMTLEAGKSGSMELLAGKYTLALQLHGGNKTVWLGDAWLSGENMVYIDAPAASAAIIEIEQRLVRHTILPPLGNVAPEDLLEYNRQLDQLSEERSEKLDERYPLLRSIPLGTIRDQKTSPDKYARRSAALMLKKIRGEAAIPEILELFVDTEVFDLVDREQASWPLIALLRDEVRKQAPPDLWKNARFYQKATMGDAVMSNTKIVYHQDTPLNALIGKKCAAVVAEAMPIADDGTRLFLAFALAEIGEPGYEDIYLELLKRNDKESRLLGLMGLKTSATDKSLPVLEKMLAVENERFNLETLARVLEILASKYKFPFRTTRDTVGLWLAVDSKQIQFHRKPYLFKAISREYIDDSVFESVGAMAERDREIVCDGLAAMAEEKDLRFLKLCIDSPEFYSKASGLRGLARLKSDEAATLIVAAKDRFKDSPVEYYKALWENASREAFAHIASDLRSAPKCADKYSIFRGSGHATSATVQMVVDDYLSAGSKAMGCAPYEYGSVLKEIAADTELFAVPQPEGAKRMLLLAWGFNAKPGCRQIIYNFMKDSDPKVREEARKILLLQDTARLKKKTPELLLVALSDEGIPKDELISFLAQSNIQAGTPLVERIFLDDINRGVINYPAIHFLSKTPSHPLLSKAVPLIVASIGQRQANLSGRASAPSNDEIVALGEIGDDQAVFALAGQIQRYGGRGTNFLMAIKRSGNHNIIPFLLQLLSAYRQGEWPGFATGNTLTELDVLITIFGAIPDQRAFPPLLEILRDGRTQRGSYLYENLLETLGKIGGLTSDKILVEELDAINQDKASGELPSGLSRALVNIRSPEVLGDLLRILGQGDTRTRDLLIEVIGNIPDEQALETLLAITRDSRSAYSLATRKIVGYGEAAVEPLATLYGAVGREQREAIVSALKEIGSRKALLALAGNLQDQIPSQQVESITEAVRRLNPEFFIKEPNLQQIAVDRLNRLKAS